MFDEKALRYLAGKFTEGLKPFTPDDSESELMLRPIDHDIVSLESFQKAPNRIKADVRLASTDSFCEYINRYKGDSTSLYLDVDRGFFEAIIDHHEKDEPSWTTHRASFTPKQSIEWKAWHGVHGTLMTQQDLSEHIEGLLHTIVKPSAATVLHSCLKFQANENLVLKSYQNLDNGTMQFTFNKDNVTNKVEFPHRIVLEMPIFEHEGLIKLELRIRYTVSSEGVLKFRLAFVDNPHMLIRDALLKVAKLIIADADGVPCYEGGFKKSR